MESLGNQFPGGNLTVPKPVLRDPRRSVRQKVHTPAYASLQGSPDNAILDLCEILDISERGALLQTPKGWELGSALDLLLDFSETQTKLRTRGEVVWTDAGGRVGVRFPDLTEDARRQLQEWLFLNMMVAAANHAVGVVPRPALTPPLELESPVVAIPEELVTEPESVTEAPLEMAAAAANVAPLESLEVAPVEAPADSADETILETEVEIEPEPLVRSDYTTTLSVLAAVQREVEGLGTHPEAALQLVAERARSLTRAAGAAVAVEHDAEIVCVGSSGSAPPVGIPIDRSAGISGRCVKTGLLQRCEDSEHDTRVNRDSCRELGVRSILAVPVRFGGRVSGLVEVFSPESHAFGDFEATVLQRLSETVQAVLNRTSRPSLGVTSPSTPVERNQPSSPASSDPVETMFQTNVAPQADAGMGFLRKHLMVLVSFAVLILVVMIYMLAARLGKHSAASPSPPAQASTVQASSAPEPPPTQPPNIEELRLRAQQGDPYAQFSLGSRYATGEDEAQDYAVAGRWFLKAAEQGMVLAQDTLGAYYWAGRGVSKDVVKAYYWSSVAKLAGNQASQVRMQFLTPQLTREQAAAIQRQAADFFQKHPPLPNENLH